jgi:hypothetical protein
VCDLSDLPGCTDCDIWKHCFTNAQGEVDEDMFQLFRRRVNSSPIWDRKTRLENEDMWRQHRKRVCKQV